MVVASLASSSFVIAFADEKQASAVMSDDYASIDGSAYQAYLDSLTDEQLQVVREKEKRLDEIEKQIIENQLTSRAVTKYVLPGSFMMFQQETDTYCVPACIKSALIYIIGISQTQSEINSVIKKDFAKILAYMNLMQNKSTYLLTDLSSERSLTTAKSRLTAAIFSSVYIDKVPAFLQISGTTKSDWNYEADGHCVLAYGISSDKSTILIGDPLGGWSGCGSLYYEKDSETVAKHTTVCY